MVLPFPVLVLSISGALVGLSLLSALYPRPRHLRPMVLASSEPTSGALSHIPPSFPYDRAWYTEVVAFSSLSLDKCRLCSYDSRSSNSDSSDTDVILAFISSSTCGLIPFCRSVRTVGCNARVILLMPEATAENLVKSEQNIIKNCGIEIVSYGKTVSLWWENELLLRYSVIYDYLYHHRQTFSRVFIATVDDVMFQADPFTPNIQADSVYFFAEEVVLNASRFEKFDVQKLPIRWPDYEDRLLLTDTLLVGGASPILVFLDMYLTYYSMAFGEGERTSELAYFLFCFYQFVERSKRLSYQVMTSASGFVGLGYYAYNGINLQAGDLKMHRTKKYATVIFHYPRSSKFLYSYFDRCPREKMKVAGYMPILPEGYMNGTLDRAGNVKVVSPPDDTEE